ncbi:hypothetical protein ACN4EK_15585 [Pantanalinema rosaneae CENA516]|uniref:hypothetical protein n=1 Tax=Pantanalinema rosaneae TaxID=1620701 RepID=UPI003D6ED09E
MHESIPGSEESVQSGDQSTTSRDRSLSRYSILELNPDVSQTGQAWRDKPFRIIIGWAD